MRIRISSFGSIRVEGTGAGGHLELPEHTSVEQFLRRLPLEPELRRHIPVVVNGELVERSYVLQEDDELMLVLPITGGH